MYKFLKILQGSSDFSKHTSCAHFAHILYTSCAHLAHILHTSCTHIAHILHTFCAHVAHTLWTSCTHIAHILHIYCTHLAHILHKSCTHIAHIFTLALTLTLTLTFTFIFTFTLIFTLTSTLTFTLTFILTFTSHLQIDGASSRSNERHIYCFFLSLNSSNWGSQTVIKCFTCTGSSSWPSRFKTLFNRTSAIVSASTAYWVVFWYFQMR